MECYEIEKWTGAVAFGAPGCTGEWITYDFNKLCELLPEITNGKND